MSKKLINKSKAKKSKKTSASPKNTKKTSSSTVTPELLMEWMESKFLTEVEFENKDFHFRASKNGSMPVYQNSVQPSFIPQMNAPTSTPVLSTAVESVEPSKIKKILSPFVGTFYRSSNPEADPFVKEGQRVSKGDTLCIIEAMKLMNEIESEFHGRITSILIENGQPVEFGEPLFLIDPDL